MQAGESLPGTSRAGGLPPLAGGSRKPSKPLDETLPAASVALAYPDALPAKRVGGHAWKVWLVCGDCFLIVLVHLSKDADGSYGFNPIAVNLLVEVVKTLFALGTLIAYGTGRPGIPLTHSLESFARDASHNRLLAVPALLYAVNNYLKFVMQLYFKPTTAKMLGNSKILVIAVLMRSVLRRSFTTFQWEALFLLVAGITVNQLNYCAGQGVGGMDAVTPAAVAFTLSSITIPSLASVYNEAALKRHMDTSVLLQNFFLYFYGACFNAVGLLAVAGAQGSGIGHLFHGFGTVTLLLVVNNALQGILSSFFFKFADTILKKYSSTIATIFTGIMSAALFGHALTLNFCLGVSIVSPSMDHLALRGPEGKAVDLVTAAESGMHGRRISQAEPLLPR
ncbi:putative UDP-sugar transporter protein SLC35A5 [Auxenochlorella protothecoides]|uniref:Putative UDP-sugar transporter protein SLC35A5 n=1 Tax=Auxenochlorella protothecoides TaxID=3075 RepID=A0A087SPZ8_AUXPR|nr:putative UDP-sugar transporter protein SLC35A5 [Auxenochlorella protothecoides]KFM27802.1 putative UDP-sugar transporter protein SLC35A5 [Auxenochlorella protothecoides]RMZ54370.1 hypothetical protein APUTEX25_001946 [Auxenochlorella protothecoides]|eukprot:RMZ54370.1 hypothetical protein APUTEX25_001946 [Auxenochlorella protothecoides]